MSFFSDDYRYKTKEEILNLYEENDIFYCLLDDDLNKFISMTNDKPNNLQKTSILEKCCYYGSEKIFKYMRNTYNTNITNQCLSNFFLSGNPEIIREVTKFIKPDEECMKNCLNSHNLDFVVHLMNNYSMEIDIKDCISSNNLQAFLILVDQGEKEIECFVKSPFFYIPSLCELFLPNRNDLSIILDENGNSPLISAYHAGNYEATRILIENGFDVNCKNNDGMTPLHYSAVSNNIEIAKILINHGANVNEIDSSGNTPLHVAASNNFPELAELFIKEGCNIEIQNISKMTALNVAAIFNYAEVARVLLKYHNNGQAINIVVW